MGCNYYMEPKPPCECCGRSYEQVHIGKSSAGWCFALHVYPEQGLNDLPDWKQALEGKRIVDEYGKEHTLDSLLIAITKRNWEGSADTTRLDEWCKSNYAEPGPNGLSRHKIDGYRCIGHGLGTWDLHIGDFS